MWIAKQNYWIRVFELIQKMGISKIHRKPLDLTNLVINYVNFRDGSLITLTISQFP